MSRGNWLSTIGSVSTPICSPSTRSCSWAAGRRTSSDAIRTLRLSRSFSRLAILAVVVVLPEPCRPTIIIATGAGALRSTPAASAPSISTSASLTILTTIWPGVTDLTTSWPTACSLTLSMKSRTTSSATSASIRARRTSRMAAETSASESAPRLVSLSNMPPRRSERVSNICSFLFGSLGGRSSNPGSVWRKDQLNAKRTRGRNSLAGVDPPASRIVHLPDFPCAGRPDDDHAPSGTARTILTGSRAVNVLGGVAAAALVQ